MSKQALFDSIVLTVICDDRPGIIARLSHLVEEHGGNWTESSMMSLAGKFAGILLAHVPAEQSESLIGQLLQLEGEGMQITAHRSSPSATNGEAREFVLELIGQDRPGIVHDITSILSRHGVNVLELESGCESASMSGEMLFKAKARLRVPPGVSRGLLRDELEQLANELMVDISLQD
jgi:glycine cleavage system regulatory protein